MNSQWLYVSFPPSFTVIGYVRIYIVSARDYVSNVNFSVGAPEWTPDNNKKLRRKTKKRE